MSQASDFIPQFKEVFSKMHGDLPAREYEKVRQFVLEEITKQDRYCRVVHVNLSVKELEHGK